MTLSRFTSGQLAALACAWEVSAPKPGNVHRGADFDDASLYDFLTAGIGLGHSLDRHLELPLGQLILQCARDARQWSRSNLNLGLILLLAPLAKARGAQGNPHPNRESVIDVLNAAGTAECNHVYEAIRLCQPAGLDEVGEADIRGSATSPLRDTMRLAAERDLVARQLANAFDEVFNFVTPRLAAASEQLNSLDWAIVYTHLQVMAEFPDSLIARKCGSELARQAAARAASLIDRFPIDSLIDDSAPDFASALADFDFWLRVDGHQRNPGTTADLIAAGLFIAMAGGTITFP